MLRASPALALLLLVFAACSGSAATAGGGEAAPTNTATTPQAVIAGASQSSAPPSAAVAFAPPTDPEGARAMEHVRVLAVDVGSRVAGSPEELRAAEYVRNQLLRAGYEASLEEFTVEVPRDESVVLGVMGRDRGVSALAMAGVPDGEASGVLVAGGLGRREDLEGIDARDKVLLVTRGTTPFADKAAVAQRAGAVALIVANNQPGPFRGTINDPSIRIPVVGVTSEDAALLDNEAARVTRLTVRASRKSEPFVSHNVVSRPSSQPCRAYVGAHYDSVAQGPGANDNASGVGAVLELARTHRVPGLCYLAFGSEELGLYGSKAFVRDHDVSKVEFMLNLDMVGKRTSPEFVANEETPSKALADRASAVASRNGVSIPRGSFPAFASSDHVSFAGAGVPAITIHSGDDEFIHTPQDTVANVSVEDLDSMLRVTSLVLRDLLASER